MDDSSPSREQRAEEIRMRLLDQKPLEFDPAHEIEVVEPARKTIWFGARGPEVVALQQGLEQVGIYSIADGDDLGLFGRATESAVRALQLMYDLPVNAIVDEETWRAIDE